MAEIIPFTGITKLNLPADRILDRAKDAGLDGVVVLGFVDGQFYAASSYADGGTVLWLLEMCKRDLFASSGGISK